MDVRDLAPALLAVGQLFDSANKTLNGSHAKSSVQVKATSPGSFDVWLELSQTPWQHVVEIFSSDSITAAVNIRDLIFSGWGLLWLIKKLRGRKADAAEELDDGSVRLTTNGDSLVISKELYQLAKEKAIRSALNKLINEPLKKDGIETFTAHDGEHTETVQESQGEYFAAPLDSTDILVDETIRKALSIRNVAFTEGHKWKVSDGISSFYVHIDDSAFVERINESRIAFAKGDVLICDVRMKQAQTPSGLKAEYTIERVVEHKPAGHQTQLDFGDAEQMGKDSGPEEVR